MRINALGARVRLVKGAYKEPKAVAYQHKADVDAAFVRMMKMLLAGGTYPAIATHDPAMIDRHARDSRRERGIPPRPLRVPDAVRHPPRPAGGAREGRATACASTSRSAANGSPTSCAGSASARPTSRLSSAGFSASGR